MAKINVPGWANREGTAFWKDRVKVMQSQIDNNLETGKILLFDELMKLSGKKDKLADIGCGIGRRSLGFPGLDYYGFDRETVALDEARRRYPEITFNLVDAQEIVETLPKYKGFFDVVSTFHVVQYNHVKQQAAIFDGFRHLLRDGGYLYLKENTIYANNNNGLYVNLKDTHSINEYSYTEAGWVHALEKYGFKLMLTCGVSGHYIFRKDE